MSKRIKIIKFISSALLLAWGNSFAVDETTNPFSKKEIAMELTDLDKKLELVNPKGDVLLGICTKIVLYFDKGHTTEKRQAILTMFDEYRTMLKEQVTFTQDRKYDWVDLRQQSAPEVKEWLLPLPPDWQWEFLYKGGNREYDASNVNFSVLGKADWEEKQGYLSQVLIHFPLTFFVNYQESVQDVLILWLGYLQPVHGYAGIGTCRHLEEDLAYRDAEYSVAQKYPGLEITHEILKLRRDTIKGISWQMILSRELLDKGAWQWATKPVPTHKEWKNPNKVGFSDYAELVGWGLLTVGLFLVPVDGPAGEVASGAMFIRKLNIIF